MDLCNKRGEITEITAADLRLCGRFRISRGNSINKVLHYCISNLFHHAIEERNHHHPSLAVGGY